MHGNQSPCARRIDETSLRPPHCFAWLALDHHHRRSSGPDQLPALRPASPSPGTLFLGRRAAAAIAQVSYPNSCLTAKTQKSNWSMLALVNTNGLPSKMLSPSM